MPYQSGKNRDETQQEIAIVVGLSPEDACLIGYPHKYTIDALGFFYPASGSYKIRLKSFSKGMCQPAVSQSNNFN